MDRRGWLWKKKSSDKITKAEKPDPTSESVGSSSLSSVARIGDQDYIKNKNYVQISMESYTRFAGLEDQVENLEDELKALEAKLTAAYSDLDNKDNLVKQHAKVAEEAVSGWEKADAEVVSLRRELESMTLSKLAVDEKASYLDRAMKECMNQLRSVKEAHGQNMQQMILRNFQQQERIKLEFEAQIDEMAKELREKAGENAALLRSLQESSNQISRLREDKSEAEAEVELLKKNAKSYEKEISSLKYELHMISKEMDIRNEEKNMLMRSAEVANKQHKEDVKNIAKLEGECQRLRSLLRKKLPGPAALAQMKLEVENSHHQRRTNLKTDGFQDSEFLTKQLEVLEEEAKTLKAALASSNAELQASRNLYAKTVGRLKSLEEELHVFHLERSSKKLSCRISSNPPSITSISDNGHEDPESPVESCAASIPDHYSDITRVRSLGEYENHRNETMSELMDDFLEMEKMACLSDNGNVPLGIISKVNDDAEDKQLVDLTNRTKEPDTASGYLPTLKKLQSIVSTIATSETRDSSYIRKLFEDLQVTVCELRDYFPTSSDCPMCLKANPNGDNSISSRQQSSEANSEHLAELKAQLESSQKSYTLAEIQLKCITESYKSLQTHMEELEAENKFLKEKIDELKNDLAEEKQCHHDALARYQEIEDKMQRDKCSVCASNSVANNDINTKDAELAAAEKKLAECQETLHILSKQLQSMCPQIRVTMPHHSKNLQMNEKLVKPTYGWSNEIDHAEASSVSSDIQGVSDEFSSRNSGSTSCFSDSDEGNFSLNSSVGSCQPNESNSCSSASATGKHAHFCSSK